MELGKRRAAVLQRILSRLNQNQLKAVTADTHSPLQIIAGPGTGKTSVLTARVAFLLLEKRQEPHHIIVTTFTKKAANEMVERLRMLIPEDLGLNLSKLLIGTFHSICVRILKQNGHRIGLPTNFKIADDRDSKEVLGRLLSNPSTELVDLKNHMAELRKINQQGQFDVDIFQENMEKHQGYDIDKIRRQISSLKSTGIEHEAYSSLPSKSHELSHIYSEYQNKLLNLSYLDFDDLLVYTRILLKSHQCLPYIKHVLVDEFQDTNKIQLELLYLFSSQSKDYCDNVTIVGDPDQSIYAFRNAVSENFEYMRAHYKHAVEVIFLEQNYRSTNAVLQVSESLMKQEQDTTRKAKDLRTALDHDFEIVSNRFDTNKDEAEFMANEISHLLNLPNLFNENEIAILLRARFHSRVIEQSLRKYGIPYKVLQGKAFWELKEIQTMIDYLRCISLESDVIPFMRVINVPPRGIGPKSLEQIRELIDRDRDANDSVLTFLEDIASQSNVSNGLTNSTRKGVNNFVQVVKQAKSLLLAEPADVTEGVSKMFDYLMAETNLIEKTRPEDPKTTENNLKEFKREIQEFQLIDRSLPHPDTGEIIEEDITGDEDGIRFLYEFIESVDLYEKDPEEGDTQRSKVTISTIHGAKGLEWPIVFVPNLTESYFPASWALKEETDRIKNPKAAESAIALINEERRALYVAMTRAKTSLYLCGFQKKIFGGDEDLQESRFLKGLQKYLKDRNQGLVSLESLKKFYSINSKQFPEEANADLKRVISNYHEYHDSEKSVSNSIMKHSQFLKSQAIPTGGAFITTASSVFKSSKKMPIFRTPTSKRKFSTMSTATTAPSTKKTTITTKKSFAPAYIYSRAPRK